MVSHYKKSTAKKKNDIEKAMDDVKAGRVYGPYDSAKELFQSMGIDTDLFD